VPRPLSVKFVLFRVISWIVFWRDFERSRKTS